MYTHAEAGKLAGVSAGTVRDWMPGYLREAAEAGHFNGMPSYRTVVVSFLDLVEIVIAARFRAAEHASFPTVRQAHQFARDEFRLAYPFAYDQLKSIAGLIVQQIRQAQRGPLDGADMLARSYLPAEVQEVVSNQIEYQDGLAARWYPKGFDVPIVVDPRITSGAPAIEGRGVTMPTIYKRWRDGKQSIAFIADDFELEPETVERALQYWEKVAL